MKTPPSNIKIDIYQVIAFIIFISGSFFAIKAFIEFVRFPPGLHNLLGIEPGHTVTELILWYAIMALLILLSAEGKKK